MLRDLSRAQYDNSLMTTEKCIQFCSDLNFDYAGTQNMTSCFCHDSYGKFGIENSTCNCDKKCAGNNTQMCGGKYSNSLFEVLYIDNCYETIGLNYWTSKNQTLLSGKNHKCHG